MDDNISLGRLAFRVILWCAGLTIFFGILGVVLGIVSLPFQLFGSAQGVITKTIDPNNVIYNYDWFKQQCQDIQAQNKTIAVQQKALDDFVASAGPRTDWTFEDKTEYARLGANVSAAKSYQNTMIGDYNAHATELNRRIFNTGTSCDLQVTR